MSEVRESHVDVEVRYAETDQMGVVHHSVYAVWFEIARTELCSQTGYHYADIEKMGYNLVVTALSSRHVKPAHYGDTVRVSCTIDRLFSRGVHFAYRVHHGETLLAEGRSEHIWLAAATKRPCRAPEALRRPFDRLAGQDQD